MKPGRHVLLGHDQPRYRLDLFPRGSNGIHLRVRISSPLQIVDSLILTSGPLSPPFYPRSLVSLSSFLLTAGVGASPVEGKLVLIILVLTLIFAGVWLAVVDLYERQELHEVKSVTLAGALGLWSSLSGTLSKLSPCICRHEVSHVMNAYVHVAAVAGP